MITDWTITDPHYFYIRGAIFGYVLAVFLGVFVAPWIKRKFRKKVED